MDHGSDLKKGILSKEYHNTHAFIFQNLHSMESHVDNHLVKKHSIKRLSNLTYGQSKAKFEEEIELN